MSDKSEELICTRHGASYATFMCHHLIQDEELGFFSADDPDDDRPDAWCGKCDLVLMEEGEWNDKSEAFADIKVLCAGCYDEVRRRNIIIEKRETNKRWTLENALDVHLSRPDTFYLPPEELRKGLAAGDSAKLIFIILLPDNEEWQGERMWVSINKVDEVGYWGTLENQPYTKGSIESGDKVLFGPEHIIDLIKAE